MFKDGLLKGKRILVTGGGTGLGREIATRYLQLGAELWLAGRRGAVLESSATQLTSKYGGTVNTHAVDIRDAQAVDAMVQRIWDESGPLTGLVNNAAGNFISPTESLTANGFNAIANIVFHGSFYVTHAVEWGRHGVRLNAIAPGPFPTEGAAKRLRPEGGFEDASAGNPMRRVGRMPELQNLATFLMADGCEWLSGETIALDGAGTLANGASFTELDQLSDADWARMRAKIKAQNEKDRAGRGA